MPYNIIFNYSRPDLYLCAGQHVKNNTLFRRIGLKFSDIKTIPIRNRTHKMSAADLGTVPAGDSFADFYDSLPDILGAKNIKQIARAAAAAAHNGKEVILAMGAHPIK